MAVGVCLGWLPFVGRSLSPDEAGYLIVGGQWTDGSSLYGDYWVDRPPALIAIFEAADALGGAVPLRLIGALAARPDRRPVRRARPDRRAGAAVGSPAHGRHGGGVRGHAAVRRHRGQRRAARAAVPGRRDPGATSRPRPAATRSVAFLLSLAAGAAGAIGALVKQSMVDVFVVARRAGVHERGGPQEAPGAARRRAGHRPPPWWPSPGRGAPSPPTSGTPWSRSASTPRASSPATAATRRRGWPGCWVRSLAAACRSWSRRSPGRAAARRPGRGPGPLPTSGWRRTSCSPSSCWSPSWAAATGCTT